MSYANRSDDFREILIQIINDLKIFILLSLSKILNEIIKFYS